MPTNLLYILPAAVIIIWAIRILTKEPPLLPVHKISTVSFLLIAFACIMTSIALGCDTINFWVFIFSSIIMSSFAPTYFLYMRIHACFDGITQKCYLMYIPTILLTLCYIILAVGLTEAEKAQLMDYLINSGDINPNSPTLFALGDFATKLYYIVPVQIIVVLIWSVIYKLQFIHMTDELFAGEISGFSPDATGSIIGAILMIITLPMLSTYAITSNLSKELTYIFTIIITGFSFYSCRVIYSLQFSANGIYTQLGMTTINEINENAAEMHLSINEEEENTKDNIEIQHKWVEDESEDEGTNTQQANLNITSNESTRPQVSKTYQEQGNVQLLDIVDPYPSQPTKRMISRKDMQRIQDELMFTDPNLTLNSLADKLETNRTYLSQAIHYYFHTNLSGLIKDMRIEYVLRALDQCEPDKVNIQKIASDAGYLYMSTFYRDFNKVAGCTPKQYLQTNK